ncbi:hydroxyacylglutathione hydrolase [Crucibulum laeve]|uniref:hydroxyacylglutathione hydrolase n=1 Tax=Crucibulum laeve TaxID=68775 RepID=A0A5C3MCV9_9AGAR|nr:hydroxyacylglutathione hydrolase [Crucibulum laeve]
MKVVSVPVRDDNYAYLLIDEPSNKAAAVDPYDVPKVTEAAKKLGVDIVALITTHHHFDHSGGNKEFVRFLYFLRASKYPDAIIYGGSSKVPALTKLVKDNDEFTIGENIHVKCLSTPCHTQDSICYYVTDKSGNHPGGVFTGDTLFIAGCGRFFEGTGAEMLDSLNYLATLPAKTLVFNGHEYTAGNVAFGKHIDPENTALARLARLVEQGSVNGTTTISDEKEWNVFMRLESEAVRVATAAKSDTPSNVVMDSLREQKNNFRG